MRARLLRSLQWIGLILCCTAGAAALGETQDARLREAKTVWAQAERLSRAGKHADAIAQGERALALQESVLGKDHLTIADALETLAELHEAQGLYPGDESLFQKQLDAGVGENRRALSQMLYDQSLIGLGTHARAVPLLERALDIREAALGEKHPEVARTLHALASLYHSYGAYGLAEIFYVRAINRGEDALGRDHPAVAASLDGLARLYVDEGFLDGAEVLHQRALAIREAAPGKSRRDVAASLAHLGRVYLGRGELAHAEPLFQRALSLMGGESALDKNDPEAVWLLDDLGMLSTRQGQYARAALRYERALAFAEAARGGDHALVATLLNHRGLLHAYQRQYARAEPLFVRALSLQETALGPNHPDVAATLSNLARLRWAQARPTEAIPLLSRALDISERGLRRVALVATESQLAGMLWRMRGEEDMVYALLRAAPEDSERRRLALRFALLRKSRSAAEISRVSRSIHGPVSLGEKDTLERLSDLRTRLATLALSERGSLAPEEYQRRLRELTGQRYELEWRLVSSSALPRMYDGLPSPEEIIDRVREGLPEDGALVEFVTFTDSPVPPEPEGASPPPSAPSAYLALVLLPDAEIRAVDLGPAQPVDRAASLLRDALARRDADFQTPAQALYQLVFRPLEPLLDTAHRLFLSPDGQLNLVPFAALHDGRRFLVDAFDFSYLTSGRDLRPRLDEKVATPSSSVLVLADPDFSTRRSPPDAERAELAWAPLPGTRQEAEAIQRLVPQARLLLGAEATKERLLHVNAPGVLHLATHGFFLGDDPSPEGARSVGHFGALGDALSAEPPEDPLLRSGLVLAGSPAPAPAASSAVRAGRDSARITALELSGLNLWGTQLVVLSACDTGRGVARQGQGVYGLRRALFLAGAETIVMSLWKVNDDTTRQLMESYYRNLLAGQGRASALREAMLALRRSHPHPHSWAPFIVLGRDTPLSGFATVSRDAPKP